VKKKTKILKKLTVIFLAATALNPKKKKTVAALQQAALRRVTKRSHFKDCPIKLHEWLTFSLI
jgi:hypothetical protein